MLNARAVAGVERSMADATAGYQPPDDACALRMASSAAWLSYRTVDYPVPDTYRALARPGKPAAEVVIRRSGLLGLPALFGARLDAASPRELGEQAGLILRQAMREGCAFAALWAPRRGAWSRALWRRGFAPVQHKQLLVAQNASGALLELLPRLRLDMLDSDKI